MQTRSIATQIDINAAPSAVWRVLCDWAAYPEWNPFIVGLHGRQQTGSRLVVSIHPPGRPRLTFRPRLEVLQTADELAWLGRALLPGLLDGRHSFRLEALENGGTRLHHDETFSGLLLPLFGQALLTDARKGFELMNQALKRRAETLASAGAA
ncbi:SRPBCC domain-containing protein [Chromobacterium haemolyticum]|uniref:SRPBCC domain-containing protein n=1 Tax=Chromobacterium haemolyticum TaxID=394935 RepID=UPI000302659B|nr:SRPBCC domain-containing protein [Chromobacterium haemolyticum]